MADLTDKEKRILAYTLLGEAAGEGRAGMEAVMWSIMNRANSGRYPSNPALVATQKNSKGVHQYSTWNKKSLGGNSPDTSFSVNSPQFKEALQVVQRVMAGEVEDPTGGATHYYSGDQKPGWFDSEAEAGEIRIGNHRFAARNTVEDTINRASTASDAAELLGTGRVRTRPAMAYAPVPEETPPAGDNVTAEGLAILPVQTISVNSRGELQPRLNPSNPAPGGTAPARQPVISRQVPREAVRLSQYRSNPQNVQDLVSYSARETSTNLAAAQKEDRIRAEDRVGAAATIGRNPAAVTKTARYSPPVKPAVQAQNKTIEQIGREAENARRSGYREIQEAGPSSKGAKAATPTIQPKSGTTKTAGTVRQDGTRMALAGEVQLPRTVRPQVVVPEKPKSVTTFVKPVKVSEEQAIREASPFALPGKTGTRTPSGITVLEADPTKQLPKGKLPLDPVERAKATPQGPQRRGRGAKIASDIRMKEPELEQVIAVRDVARPRGPIARRPANYEAQRLARGAQILAARPIVQQTPAQQVAAAMAAAIREANGIPDTGAYRATDDQSSRFQITEGSHLPSGMNTERWLTYY